MRLSAPTFVLAAATLAACAGNPKPGEPGYPYNLDGTYSTVVVVEGTPYRGTVTLATGDGGAVSGRFTITDPTQVMGSIEGSLAADTVRFEMPYEIQENGCAGTLYGNAPVTPGGAGFEGPVRLDDSCGGELSGTMAVTR